MSAVIDAAVLALVVGMARAGWRRGITSILLDLSGFSAAVLAAVLAGGRLAAAYRRIGLSPGWSALAGGLTVFVPLIVAVAAAGRRLRKLTSLPGLRMTDKVAGMAAGLAWAAVSLTILMSVARVAAIPGAGLLEGSPAARRLLSPRTPLTGAVAAAVESHRDLIVRWVRPLFGQESGSQRRSMR